MTEPSDVQPEHGLRTGPVARLVVQPILRFTAVESAAGIILVVATVVALVWANSGLSDGYRALWLHEVNVSVGRLSTTVDLRHIVDDGLMTVFFFVVGLEIKREWCYGELRDRRAARASDRGSARRDGRARTALHGVRRIDLRRSRVGHPDGHRHRIRRRHRGAARPPGPAPIKLFLLTLAIVDDLGAIVVIAVFYAGRIDAAWLGVAVVGLGLVAGLRALGVARYLPYALVGVVVWFATWQSGVHATIAGVALALLTPAHPVGADSDADADADAVLEGSPLSRLEDLLHPWASFVIVPVFALANAGVELTTDLPDAGFRVTVGVVVGLVVGKLTGVVGASWLAVRLRFAALPQEVGWKHLAGAGALAGIGFTMSLFVTELAFVHDRGGGDLVGAAKQAILFASVVAAGLGSLVFLLSGSSERARDERP